MICIVNSWKRRTLHLLSIATLAALIGALYYPSPGSTLSSTSAEENVKLIMDITLGTASSNPTQLMIANGTLYFVVNNELWKSDGTEAGTSKIIDAADEGRQYILSNPHDLIELNAKLYFSAWFAPVQPQQYQQADIGVTDGTPNGTKRLNTGYSSGAISQLTRVREELYYVVDDCGQGTACAILARTNPECWIIAPGMERCDLRFTRDAIGALPHISNLTDMNGTLFFVHGEHYSIGVGEEAQFHWQLWKAGQVLPTQSSVVGDIPGDANNPPREFIVVNDTLYFVANDKLWRSNGTTIEPIPSMLGPQPPLQRPYSYPRELTNVNGKLYFVSQEDGHAELWTLDGGTGYAKRVFCNYRTTTCTGSLNHLTNVNGILYFVLIEEEGYELLKYDSDRILAIKRFPVTFFPLNHLTNVNGTLFFSADDGTNGTELWTSNGTEPGTVLVADIARGSASSDPSELTNVNGTLFFTANDGVHGNELWKTAVDNIPPSSTNLLSGTQGTNGWYRSNVEVTLNAIDNAGSSGVQKIEYGFNYTPWNPFSGPWNEYTGPLEISMEGHTYLVYRSTDNAGNVESNQTQLIKIDKTPPEISVHPFPLPNSNGWYNTNLDIEFWATDFQSGIASLTPTSYKFTEEGAAQRVTSTVIDNAGNSASFTVSNINFDKTPPTINITTPQAKDYLHSDSFAVAWSASDSLSGMEINSAMLDGQPVSNGQTIDLFFLSLGSHMVILQANDKADNGASMAVTFNVTADINSLRAVTQRAYDLGWIEKQGAYNSLDARLRTAQQNLERNQLNAASRQLRSFVDRLDAEKNKTINQQVYELLKADALYVIEHLQ